MVLTYRGLRSPLRGSLTPVSYGNKSQVPNRFGDFHFSIRSLDSVFLLFAVMAFCRQPALYNPSCGGATYVARSMAPTGVRTLPRTGHSRRVGAENVFRLCAFPFLKSFCLWGGGSLVRRPTLPLSRLSWPAIPWRGCPRSSCTRTSDSSALPPSARPGILRRPPWPSSLPSCRRARIFSCP